MSLGVLRLILGVGTGALRWHPLQNVRHDRSHTDFSFPRGIRIHCRWNILTARAVGIRDDVVLGYVGRSPARKSPCSGASKSVRGLYHQLYRTCNYLIVTNQEGLRHKRLSVEVRRSASSPPPTFPIGCPEDPSLGTPLDDPANKKLASFSSL